MSFLTILKTIGKDLSHVGQWVDDGLKIAAPIVDVIDPPLAPAIAAVEAMLDALPKTVVITPDFVQKIVTAVVAVEATRSAATKPAPG